MSDEKQPAIICDVDGTVALMNGKRSPFAYDKADKDEPNLKVIDTVLAMKKFYSDHPANPYSECKLIFLSARENVSFNIDNDDNKSNHKYNNSKYDNSYQLTCDWLNKYVGKENYDELILRDRGNWRKDCYVKYDIYKNYIEGIYYVLMVFDDRDQVVDMWRNGLKLQCFQVADGNF
tara:strand:+ start:426 stop:956 length:531 start_codon:yes stop_codon:yes gene_type:complete